MYSYEQILDSMVNKYQELSGFVVNEESDIMIRLKVLSSQLYTAFVANDFIKNQMFVQTATDTYLDKHALERGIQRKEAQKAQGEVTFELLEAMDTDIVIEKGTIIATLGPSAKNFATDTDVTLKAGGVSATVTATAMQGGADHNVVANSVCVMVTPPLYINRVYNTKAFKGGVDKESDEELRARVIGSYQDISNGTNAIYYKRLAESVPGVYSASVVPQVRGAGTVDIYVRGKKNSEINKDQIQAVQSLIDENRELNVDLLVLYASKKAVTYSLMLKEKEGYDFEQVCSQVEQKITDYVDSRSVGESVLLCDLGELIYHTEGVSNYNFLDTYSSDIYPQSNEYCTVEEVKFRQVS